MMGLARYLSTTPLGESATFPYMHVHLIGVAGTGMGSFAGLLVESGHQVSGSDTAFYPPIGPALDAWGVTTYQGWNPDNLKPTPDLVVVGNVCRPNNPEARAAIDSGMRYASFPAALAKLVLEERPKYVVAGTHGKTTTSSLLAHTLHHAGRNPGFLIGGVPTNFSKGFSLGKTSSPFVVEGDEYDSAFFEKSPKFWQYAANAAIVTSLEHDHIDIYPSKADYQAAFDGFVARLSATSLLVTYAGDGDVRALSQRHNGPRVQYALDTDDCGGAGVDYLGCLAPATAGGQPIDVFVRGSHAGRIHSPMHGHHNARNLLAVLAIAIEHAEVPLAVATQAIEAFVGIKRRQEWLGSARGVHVYDDFAHHPTAVSETIRALKSKHPKGQLIAVYEPRSATASRRIHQQAYVEAFGRADLTLLAPVGRQEIPEAERFDTAELAKQLTSRGHQAKACESLDDIVSTVVVNTHPGDAVLVMSNGAFGGIWDRLLEELALKDDPGTEPTSL